jgi:hypothetical protein
MSLANIKTKTQEGLNDIYTALEEKSATIPEQKNLINVAPAIRSITGGGGDNSGKYVWAKYSDYVKANENIKLLLPFDENIIDSTGNNTPTLIGNNTYGNGKYGKAKYFDGTNYIKIPYTNETNISNGDFTLAFWVKGPYTTLNANTVFFGDGKVDYTVNKTYGLRIGIWPDGKLFVNACTDSNGTSLEIIPSGTFTINKTEWIHLALVRKGNIISSYLNGELINSIEYTGSFYNENVMYIGGRIRQDGELDCPLIGYIDDFVLAKEALWDGNFTPTKIEYEDTGTFEEYVVSDNENAYPNNDYGDDGFYYIKEIDKQEPEQPQVHNYLMLYDGTLGEAGEAGANVCADVTGGYKLARTDGGSYWTLLPINYNADNLFLNSDNRGNDGDGIHYYSSFITKNPIELSDYEKIGVITYMDYSESFANIRIKIYGGDSTSTETLLTIFDSSTSSGSEKGKKSCFVSDVSDLTSGHLGAFANEEGVNYSLLKMYGAFICKQDDYQPILDLAGITTTYTDEASICASQTVMTTILNNKEAIDYMVHNCTGTFMLAFLQSETALNALNASPYKVLVYQNDVWIKFLSMVA